ncbi:MAG: NAD(+) synthase [Chloroflexi bacterium RBG_16_57_8]|nr:MAG: NAD(+) synthase [Chloroflexi bacterium RBG_16_57_8]
MAVPALRVADIDFNVAAIIDTINKARGMDIQVLAFPEMSVTGYTLGDLVHQQALLSKAIAGLEGILKESAIGRSMIIVVGMPLVVEQKIFNCAVVLNSGRTLGVVPKTLLPTYREFYEDRWWSPAWQAQTDSIELAGKEAPFGTDLLFRLRGMTEGVVGVEICEDLWMPLAPHEHQALAGATVLVNISASNEVLGKADWRRTMVSSESGRCSAAYCYASSGIGESSNDIVYSGHALIAENGVVLEESKRLVSEPQLIVSDIDLERLAHDRRFMSSFRAQSSEVAAYRIVETEVDDPSPDSMRRILDPHPFVPKDPERRAERCRDIFSMQVAALAQKLQGARKQQLVIGVSGGLDSTLALLVAAKTMDFLGLSRKNVHAFTLPGFGTTRRTKSNATKLSETLAVTLKDASIVRSSSAHLKDLEHGGAGDVVFENVQARYRTEFLFNTANQLDAILLGTGDLTEIALGWSTFGGDHISHYHVNCSVPKTLVRYLVRWVADEEMADSPARKILYDILETPISPELQRPENGEIVQKSEDIIGPVELADFFLYPFVRFGMRPGRILYLADQVAGQGGFDGRYTLDDLHRWFKSFLQRFFANQFKRTCLPEGPKVGTVSLSPRGDWRMPSDAPPKLWLEDLEEMYLRLKG